ncbi:MAG: phosphodiesterase [Candidatus Bathyarchaeota archaeon B23]|nr:MAG: phosphodiesterase [Candidatus Bathyarchaeota archaeon B23]
MLVGLMADTHDNIHLIDRAVERLNQEEAQLVLHAGDYISPFTVPHFQGLKAEMIGVYGNNEAERTLLRRRFQEIGVELRGLFAEIRCDGLRIALLHGHEGELLSSLIGSGAYDVVVHGHTHRAEMRAVGGTLVINPGEVCGYLTGRCTLALLDTEAVEGRILNLLETGAR